MDEKLKRHLDEVAARCIHCGLCLPVCPTYSLTLREESSPRGRIRLMQTANEIPHRLSDQFVGEMYFCLDCQACQTACPAGVRYGELVESARNEIAGAGRDPRAVAFLKRMFLRGILASPAIMKAAASVFRWYTASGIRAAVDESGILNILPGNAAELHRLLPPVSGQPFDETVPETIPPRGGKRGRVGFLTGCIMNVSFSDVHRDAVGVLSANGYEVVMPRGQVCCGSLHAHNGDPVTAKRLARQNISVFSRYDLDALIIDSAGCGAFVKEYGALFSDDPEFSSAARALSARTMDIMEFLAGAGLRQPLQPVNRKVTYHDACHLVHTQGISSQPRELLSAIPGLELVELPEASWCCGSAGIYNVVRYPDAVKLLERKMANIAETGAEIVLTGNPGCQIQLQYGARKFGVPVNVLHPVTVLAMAYKGNVGDGR